MRDLRLTWAVHLVCLVSLLSGSVKGQQADSCAPPLPPLSAERNIFSEEQEMELGRIRAAHLEQNFKIIEDPALTDYLNQIAQRLSQGMPNSKLRFHVVIVDQQNANAFSIPGGYLYFTRRLIATFKDED